MSYVIFASNVQIYDSAGMAKDTTTLSPALQFFTVFPVKVTSPSANEDSGDIIPTNNNATINRIMMRKALLVLFSPTLTRTVSSYVIFMNRQPGAAISETPQPI